MKGWPDYTKVTGLVDNYDEYGENYPVGIGDGAARLGSIKTFDMRGRVWWLDDFEAPTLHWDTFSAGAGAAQALSTAQAWRQSQSVELTAGLGAGNRSFIQRTAQRPRSDIVGMEVTYSAEDPFDYLIIELLIRDGPDWMQSAIRHNMSFGRIEYLNQAGGWSNTGFACCLIGSKTTFITSKIVIDTAKAEYIRILNNYEELNLPGIQLSRTGIAGQQAMQLNVELVGDGLINTPAYIDDVIITTMEPV